MNFWFFCHFNSLWSWTFELFFFCNQKWIYVWFYGENPVDFNWSHGWLSCFEGRCAETIATAQESRLCARFRDVVLCVSADCPLSLTALRDLCSRGVPVDGPDDREAGARTPGQPLRLRQESRRLLLLVPRRRTAQERVFGCRGSLVSWHMWLPTAQPDGEKCKRINLNLKKEKKKKTHQAKWFLISEKN